MDVAHDIRLVVVGFSSATFFWITCVLQLEGERHTAVNRAVSVTASGMALLLLGEMARIVYPAWASSQDRLQGFWIALITTSWYATALYHTQRTFSKVRLRLAKLPLWGLGATATVFAAINFFQPSLALISHLGNRSLPEDPMRFWLHLLNSVQIIGSFVAALLVYFRALRMYRRKSRPDERRGKVLARSFLPATAIGVIGVLEVVRQKLLNVMAPQLTLIDPLLTWPLIVMFLACAFFILYALTTSRLLLERPVELRSLFNRWCFLAAFFVTYIVVRYLDASPLPAMLLVTTVGAPLVLANIDWRQSRLYRRTVDQYQQVVRCAVADWETTQGENADQQIAALFHSLVTTLRPDAVYLRVQAVPRDEPLELRHKWDQIPPRPPYSPRYTVRPIVVNERELGIIALYGPHGLIYSSRELDLAISYAHSIVNLYLAARNARAFEQLVIEHDHRQHATFRELHRLLHDQIGGNLDVMEQGLKLFIARLDAEHVERYKDLVSEILEASQSAMGSVRQLLRRELRNLYPFTLASQGLIAALESDIIPHLRQRHGTRATITLDTGGLDDRRLNGLLDDTKKRIVYGAISESLVNAIRHGGGTAQQALQIDLRLRYVDLGLRVEVHDTGFGFEPALAELEGRGMGLRYQMIAMRTIGGTLTVRSVPKHGTVVKLQLPLQSICTGLLTCPLHSSTALVARSQIEWARLVLDTEWLPGGRLLINDELSDLTRTSEVTESYYRDRVSDESVRSELINIEFSRQRIGMADMLIHPYREIVDRRRLEQYIATGTTDHGRTSIGLVRAHRHVRHIIEMLQTYKHYELALSDEPSEANVAIKPGNAVLWERRAEDGETTIDGFVEGIRDSYAGTVADFSRRFEETWKRIPPHYRNKADVIAWLEARLEESQRQQVTSTPSSGKIDPTSSRLTL